MHRIDLSQFELEDIQGEENQQDYDDSQLSKRYFIQNTELRALDKTSVYGCLSKTVSKEECLRNGAKWIEPLTTKEQCLSVFGCKDPLVKKFFNLQIFCLFLFFHSNQFFFVNGNREKLDVNTNSVLELQQLTFTQVKQRANVW